MENSTFAETPLTSAITEFALPLAALQNGVWRPSGTAVVIAPNLVLTARHVLEDHWAAHEITPIAEQGAYDGTFSLMTMQIVNGSQANLWIINKAWTNTKLTDIALLLLTPWNECAANHQWSIPRLSLLPPRPGERVSAFGYRKSRMTTGSAEPPTAGIVEWYDEPTISTGKVLEIYHEQRDRSMINFPSFAFDARCDHGMSGGPVFNSKGELCGIISSGTTPEDGADYSVAASLWPAMGIELDHPYKEYQSTLPYPLFELARRKVLATEHSSLVRIEYTAEGRTNRVVISLQPLE